MKYLTDFLALLWRHSPQKTALLFALSLAASLTEGIGLLLLVPLLSVLQADSEGANGAASKVLEVTTNLGIPTSITGLIGVFVVLIILRNIIVYFRTTINERIQMELLDELRVNSFAALIHSNWKWISSLRKTDHSNMLITETSRVGLGLTYAFQILTLGILILVYLAAALVLSIPMTLIAMVAGTALVFAMRRQHKQAQSLGENLSGAYEDMQQVVEEGLTGVKLTKILGNETRHQGLMESILTRLRTQELEFIRLDARIGAIFQIVVALVLAGIILFGTKFLSVPLASLMILILIMVRMAPLLRSFQKTLNQLLHSWPALRNISQLMETAAGQKDLPAPTAVDTKIILVKHLRLTQVSFSYSGRESASLNDISLTIPAFKTTAIMGQSGSGKSTLADLLMGLLAPDSGVISVDGTDISDQNRTLWRRSIAYVPQDVFLFHDTIKNNLLWAAPKADDGALETALTQAAADFVFGFPAGLDTVVGDAGTRLSGGERQRIALARALLQNPSLLILDEATSALDVENEAKIRAAIDKMHGDLTVVVIGHRLPTLENADHVIKLDQGQLVAQGSWDQIRAQTT